MNSYAVHTYFSNSFSRLHSSTKKCSSYIVVPRNEDFVIFSKLSGTDEDRHSSNLGISSTSVYCSVSADYQQEAHPKKSPKSLQDLLLEIIY